MLNQSKTTRTFRFVEIATATILSIGALAGSAQAQKRTDPKKLVEAMQKALDYRAKMRPATFLGGGSGGSGGVVANGVNITYTGRTWAAMGPRRLTPGDPNYLGPQTYGTEGGFLAGRVNAIAWDPANEAPSYLYAATVAGGIWRVTLDPDGRPTPAPDGKPAWEPLSDFSFPTLRTSSIAVDPTNPRILYAGTGNFQAGAVNRTVGTSNNAASVGIMKSVNRGTTWFNIGRAEMAGAAVSGIVIDPDNPKIVVATTGNGTNAAIWRSTNSGTTWTRVTPSGVTGQWSAIRIYSPYSKLTGATPRPYFASCVGQGIYRSEDRGATWTKINAPLRYNLAGAGTTLLGEPSSIDIGTVYVMDANSAFSDGRIFRGVRRKSPAGAYLRDYDWTDITGSFPTSDGAGNNWARSHYGYLLSSIPVLLPSPDNPFVLLPSDVLYGGARTLAGSSPIGKSTLASPTWENITSSASQFSLAHAFKFDLKSSPFDLSTSVLATEGGIYRLSYNRDLSPNTSVVRSLNEGLEIAQVFFADFHPTNSTRAIAGTSALGMIRPKLSDTTLQSWESVPTNNENNTPISGPSSMTAYMGPAVYDPVDPRIQYTVTGGDENAGFGNILRTTDNWASFTNISPDQVVGLDANGAPLYPFPFNFEPSSGTVTGYATLKSDLAARGGTFPFLKMSPSAQNDTNPLGSPNGNQPVLFVATSKVWRYDPPPAAKREATPSTPPKPLSIKGRWRPIGDLTLGNNGLVCSMDIGRGVSFTRGGGNVLPGARMVVGSTVGEVWATAAAGSGNSTARDFNPVATTADDTSSQAVWRNITANLPAGVPVTSISQNPNNPGDYLVTLGGVGVNHVWRCQDIAANNILWTPQDGLGDAGSYLNLPDVPVYGIVRDPADPVNTWFLATEIGVFTTTDKGSTWFDATAPLGLPPVECTAIQITDLPDNSRYLNVATNGRGLWRFNLKDAVENKLSPRLSTTFTLTRSDPEIFAVLTIKNASDPDVGPAENVQITVSSIKVGGTTQGTTVALPVALGTIGKGASKSVTLRYPSSVGKAGSAADFTVTYTYADAVDPVTTTVRTRLP